MNWRRSVWLVVGATIVFPPAGMILLWLRQETRWWEKILASVPIIILGLAYITLSLFVGIQLNIIEPTGGMNGIMFTESRYDHLSGSRDPVTTNAERAEEEFSAYWTQFRGPNRDGRYEQAPILTDWPDEGPKQLWKQPCGGGYSSFAVANGLAFTIEQRGDQEFAVAYDILIGSEVWTHSWPADFFETLGGGGPRSTPTWDDGRLYVAGATGQLWCLDAKTGDVIWNKNIQEDVPNFYYGVSGSPLVVDGMLVIQPSGKDNSSTFLALDKLTGDVIWSALNEQNEYASPVLTTLAGQRQIVSYTDKRYIGLDIEDGALLWSHPVQKPSAIHMAQPLFIDDNRIFHSASYGAGCEMFSVTQDNGVFQVESLWKNIRMKNKFASSVLHQGYIYGLDEAVFSCMNPDTGERVWKGGRYGYGQFLFASGHIILITERGELVLIKATPDGHEELARIPAIEGKTWNVPAMSDGFLLVRNANEIACYDLRLTEETPQS